MKRYTLLLMPLAFALLLGGCTETLDDFNPSNGKKRLVIDGMVLDSLKIHTVRLTRTTSFLNPGAVPTEDGATVFIEDNTGFIDTLIGIGSGYYQSSLWAGIPGRTYTLTVNLNGEVWTARDRIPDYQNFVIDSLTQGLGMNDDGELIIVDYDIDNPKILQYDQYGYGEVYLNQGDTVRSVYFYSKENKDETNFLLLKFYRNGLEYVEPGSLFVFDDFQTQENLSRIDIAGYYIPGDVAATLMIGLSPQAFAYYSKLSNAINNDGGLFSPPPGNPQTNVSNDGLGYFLAGKQAYKAILVK